MDAADRRGRHRRRRRQDVLGTPGRPPGRRAGDRFGLALDRLARPRAIRQSPAGPDHRRLYRRGRTARPLPGGARRLHGGEDPRDPQRRRRGAIPSAAAQRDAAEGVWPGRRRSRGRHRGRAPPGKEPCVVSAGCRARAACRARGPLPDRGRRPATRRIGSPRRSRSPSPTPSASWARGATCPKCFP